MSDSKIYREGDRLIKVYLSDPYEYVEKAFARQKFAHDAGLPVPAVYGIKKINETQTAIEMEYVDGKPLVYMYEGKGENERLEAMRIMAKLQCQLHKVDANPLPKLTDFYAQEISSTPYLSKQLKEIILKLMNTLDTGKTNLCHGDIHPYNILYKDKKYWIIDWEDASKGDPAADICMQYFYSMRWAYKGNNKSDEQYLQLVCEESGIPKEGILKWLPVIAGVQVNINDDEDREFISRFIDGWHRKFTIG